MEAHQRTTEIRRLGADDSRELARLAELDTASPLPGPVLGAIVDGRLVAARSLSTDDSIADPFRPTAELRALLDRRARELRGDRPGRGLIARLGRRSAGPVRSGAASQPAR
jgi:hypothetical protein